MTPATYLRNLCRAVLGADSEILTELSLIKQELHAMSVQSDRLSQSIATLNNTTATVVVPALQAGSSAPVDPDTEALFSAGADAVDAATAKLTAAVQPAAPVEPAPTTDQ